MLDSDLAKLYKVETKRINEAVKRNLNKFPERFSWILSEKEAANLRPQFATSSYVNNYGGTRYAIRVFTEQGIAMLSTILKSTTAVEVSIRIMDAFVAMRHFILDNKNLFNEIDYLKHKCLEHDDKINLILNRFNNNEIKENYIFFKGQIYDSYSVLVNIIKKSNKEIIKDNDFHDRFVIIDRKVLYHFGTSLNSIGNKCFSINEITDKDILNNIMKKIKEKIYES